MARLKDYRKMDKRMNHFVKRHMTPIKAGDTSLSVRQIMKKRVNSDIEGYGRTYIYIIVDNDGIEKTRFQMGPILKDDLYTETEWRKELWDWYFTYTSRFLIQEWGCSFNAFV